MEGDHRKNEGAGMEFDDVLLDEFVSFELEFVG